MRQLFSCLAWLSLAAACGGAPAPASSPTASEEAPSVTRQRASTPRDDAASATPAPETESAPSGPSCDDGTCSLCGAGICPAGWYCDEKAGACSWLAECVEKPSCACITRVLGPSCKCKAAGGGAQVTCD